MPEIVIREPGSYGARPKTMAELRTDALALCRAPVPWNVALLAMRAGGAPVDDQRRDELLAKAVKREYVELELDILAYEQEPGKRNGNFFRFRDQAILKLGQSGKGTPFLRDHDWYDVTARGGNVIASQAKKIADGHYQLFQTVLLTDPPAVERALRGLMTAVSIGADPTGPVLCSVCGTEIFTECYHWRGATVMADGAEQVVEWIYTSAVLRETSEVSIGAVDTARVNEIRAAILAARGNHSVGPGPREEDMNPLIAKLAPILLLAATATEDEVTRAVDLLRERLKLAESQRDELATQLAASQAALAGFEERFARQSEDDFIKAGIEAGKIVPGGQFETQLRVYFGKDPKGAAELLEAAHRVTPVGQPRQSDRPAPEGPAGTAANAKARELCAANGVDYDAAARFAKKFGARDPHAAMAKHVAGEEN
jgi:hypothetical protein